jgi:hypothetical protein
MDSTIITEIKKHISVKTHQDKQEIHTYNDVPFNKEGFQLIGQDDKESTVCFIDGGNTEIIVSPHFLLSLIRVSSVTYFGKKKMRTSKKEYFCSISTKVSGGEIIFDVQLLNNNNAGLQFRREDALLMMGSKKPSIQMIPSIVRRCLELNHATLEMDDLGNESIIVIDGSLEVLYPNESSFMEKAIVKALQKKIAFSGLSKTTALLDSQGKSLPFSLLELAPNMPWFYDVSDKVNQVFSQFCAKLNQRSEYVFRIDIAKDDSQNYNDIFSALLNNSIDPIFFGYPYGLVEADRIARVTNDEKRYYQTKYLSQLSADPSFKKLLNTLNAHSILDSVL